MAPLIGFHWVIDSPDSVRRVMPPTTTMQKTSAATMSNQRAMARGAERWGMIVIAVPCAYPLSYSRASHGQRVWSAPAADRPARREIVLLARMPT